VAGKENKDGKKRHGRIALLLTSYQKKWPSRILAAYAGFVVTAIVLVYLVIFFFRPADFFDGFLKRRIIMALEEAYPSYAIQIAGLHYRILENRIECESIILKKIDSSILCNINRLSVSGIGRVQLLLGTGVFPDNIVSSYTEAEGLVLIFPQSQYELCCERLRVSVPDSEIVIETLELHPSAGDEQFFAESKFSKTRYRLVIPHCSVLGSACLRMFEGEIHCARTAQIQNAFLDVLINKDKPPSIDSLPPLKAIKLLSSIVNAVQLDSLNIKNGRLKYSERFSVGSKPAVLTCDSMQILTEVSSGRMSLGDTVVIRAQGKCMQAGTMSVFMMIPVASPELSFRYGGFLSEMNLSRFNPFVEISEHKRIKTGILHRAEFDITVTAGTATGTARVEYKDLSIAAFDDRTGSENGIGNTVISFLSNNVKLRTTNMPDKSGSMKIGEVKYKRKGDEAFLKFAWFALRSGISDIVGF
jgi:hypothetical protein